DGGLGGLAQRLDQLVRTGRGVRGGGPQPVSGRGTGVRTRRDVRGGRHQRGAAGGGGGGGECGACPALGASEGVECGGLGERVACAAGEFDRPSGAGDRGVVQALVDECAAGLGQGQCGSGGRVVTGKLPCPGDEGVRLLPWTFPYEPAGEAVDVGGGGRQVAGGAGGVAGAERGVGGGAAQAVHVVAAHPAARHGGGVPQHRRAGGVGGEFGSLFVAGLGFADQVAGEGQFGQGAGEVIGVLTPVRAVGGPGQG